MFALRMRISSIAAIPLALAAGYSQAQTGARPPAIQALEAQGLTIVGEFDVEGGLRAFAGTAEDRPIAVYLTSDGNAIVGTRLDANGKPIDRMKLRDLVEKPLGEKTWSQLESATWVQDGKPDAPRIIYTFSDANCPYCHQFWEAARPWVDARKVQLRHLLVGVIRADSPAKAAAILGAPDPTAALIENEHKFDQGGIKPADSIPDAVLQTLEDNHMLMLSSGFRGTPGIVVRESDGSVKKFRGMPQGAQLAEVLGPR
ncbi:thiol:disulfide interchange protein DsbG [Achromobacter aegrifaciens]|uniref:thiol:disulfide interchange protein DsbG n=1 Tax=Achromobacter aegrifaciens TaxID=1287736 RepID=UPI0028ADB6A9|nr:thiol:disulfide interchange protein DsbG [Achromobacter aegrifaciens]